MSGTQQDQPEEALAKLEALTTALSIKSPADEDGLSPLHRAAIDNNLRGIEVLLRSGADVNILDTRRRTPITLAVLRGHAEAAELLENAGGKVVAVGEPMFRPFNECGFVWTEELAERLFALGARPNERIENVFSGGDMEMFDFTVKSLTCSHLHVVAWNGNAEAASLLLSHGSNPNGECFVHYEFDDSVSTYDSEGEEEYYYEEVNKQCCKAMPLHLAAHQGHADVIKRLLAFGAKTNSPTSFMNTGDEKLRGMRPMNPLLLAAVHGHHDAVSVLALH